MTDTTPSPFMNAAPVPALESDPKIPTESEKPSPSKTKVNSKVKSRARPRRRVATSDVESDADGAASEDSLTERSASEASDDEEDEDAVEDAVDHPSPEPEKSVFADISSSTPAAWADEKFTTESKGELVEVSFEEFNRGGRGRPARGRGGGAGEARKKREYTDEETRRYKEMKVKRKEKQKAKKAELKEAKKKEKEKEGSAVEPQAPPTVAAPAESSSKPEPVKVKATKAKGKKATSTAGPSVSSLVASTSALTIDEAKPIPSSDPASSSLPSPLSDLNTANHTDPSQPINDTMAAPMRGRPPRVDNRGAYAQRIANDPKFTPRVGNFWTHDQRHYEPGAVGDGGYAGLRTFSEYWRGPRGARAGFRGGFRGRGRGFPPGPGPLRRGVDGVDAGRELSNGPESRGPRLEMDKLEEMERAKAEPRIKPELPTEEVTEGGEKPLPPTTPPNERRWGHESFESVRATEQFQANRLPLRARGRGRGGFAPRGGHFGPFAPHASLPTPEKTPEAAAHLSSPAPLHVKLPAETASPEDLATQPAADGLLTELSEAVTVRLPGGGEITVPPSAPPVSLPELAPNGAAVLYTSPTPHPQEQPAAPAPPAPHPAHVNGVPIHGASPVPYANGQMQPSPQFPTVTGSENGSISSAGPFVPQQPSQYLPPGIGVTPNGDYYNLASGAPVDFHPARPFYPTHPRAFPHQQQQIFPPQSYPPDPYAQQPSHQTAFYRNGYPDGRAGSPYGNHYAQAQLGGLFAPARRTQKVSIRAPSANGTEEGVISSKTPSSGMYPTVQPQPQGQYYSQHYNPYAANGMAIQVPEGTYFDGSGSGYQPQQYGEVPAGYVYEGEYPGY